MSTCFDYLKREASTISHAVKAHLWAGVGVVLASYGIGTFLYHVAKAFNLIGG